MFYRLNNESINQKQRKKNKQNKKTTNKKKPLVQCIISSFYLKRLKMSPEHAAIYYSESHLNICYSKETQSWSKMASKRLKNKQQQQQQQQRSRQRSAGVRTERSSCQLWLAGKRDGNEEVLQEAPRQPRIKKKRKHDTKSCSQTIYTTDSYKHLPTADTIFIWFCLNVLC